MADSKISALPASTTPLAGTEVLPIVQSSTTRQVSVANLTAGRAISATQITLTTGNVIVASGQGIDFSATPNTGTSELLADYEEGNFAPVITAETGSLTYTSSGKYVKIGRQVTLNWTATITAIGTATGYTFFTVPFTSTSQVSTGGGIETTATAATITFYLPASSATATIYRYDGATIKGTGYAYSGTIVYQV
jgi:hypothetical protein